MSLNCTLEGVKIVCWNELKSKVRKTKYKSWKMKMLERLKIKGQEELELKIIKT